jgi:arginine/ornithine N-succinyltransferase beta subunit
MEKQNETVDSKRVAAQAAMRTACLGLTKPFFSYRFNLEDLPQNPSEKTL